ncbi:unnamed protein product, partial [Urochloa humidicola]
APPLLSLSVDRTPLSLRLPLSPALAPHAHQRAAAPLSLRAPRPPSLSARAAAASSLSSRAAAPFAISPLLPASLPTHAAPAPPDARRRLLRERCQIGAYLTPRLRDVSCLSDPGCAEYNNEIHGRWGARVAAGAMGAPAAALGDLLQRRVWAVEVAAGLRDARA